MADLWARLDTLTLENQARVADLEAWDTKLVDLVARMAALDARVAALEGLVADQDMELREAVMKINRLEDRARREDADVEVLEGLLTWAEQADQRAIRLEVLLKSKEQQCLAE